MIRALVLIKRLSDAKSRLSATLEAKQRAELTLAMAADVIAALHDCPKVVAIDALVGCPDGAAACVERGVKVHEDQAVAGATLNEKVSRWIELARSGQSTVQLVINADLPFLEAEDIEELYRAHSNKTLVIATDRHDRGTNALLFHPAEFTRFAWGIDSCKIHRDIAATEGLTAIMVRRDGTAIDIDTKEDLCLAARRLSSAPLTSKATLRFLRAAELAETVIGQTA